MNLFAESWNVAWRRKKSLSILNDKETQFVVIPNPIRYWAADPFLFEYDGKTYVFAELYDYVRRRGVIGYYIINEKSDRKWHPIIVENYHLSYPYVFEDSGNIYIMPESSKADSLYLYECIDFPEKWKKSLVIRQNVQCVDSTFLNEKDRDELLAYEISDIQNPKLILVDLKNQQRDRVIEIDSIDLRRPAGKVYKEGHIRPAQNCVEKYGGGLVFYKYEFTQNGEYSEKEIARVYAEDLKLSRSLFLDGIHTYNSTKQYEVVDIKTRRLNIINLVFRIYGKLKRRMS